jgi:hypothetical protein
MANLIIEELESRNLLSTANFIATGEFVNNMPYTQIQPPPPLPGIHRDFLKTLFENIPAVGFTGTIDNLYKISAPNDNPLHITILSIENNSGWTTQDGGETWIPVNNPAIEADTDYADGEEIDPYITEDDIPEDIVEAFATLSVEQKTTFFASSINFNQFQIPVEHEFDGFTVNLPEIGEIESDDPDEFENLDEFQGYFDNPLDVKV